MFIRIFLVIGLLLFVVLVVLGTDPINAAMRSITVFVGLSLTYYLGYLMIKIIGYTDSDDDTGDKKAESGTPNDNKQNAEATT